MLLYLHIAIASSVLHTLPTRELQVLCSARYLNFCRLLKVFEKYSNYRGAKYYNDNGYKNQFPEQYLFRNIVARINLLGPDQKHT